jgi:hypothetical protein
MASAISHAQLDAQLAQGTVAPLYAVVGEKTCCAIWLWVR